MKIRVGLILFVMFLSISGDIVSAPADRFRGTSFDGYDSSRLIQLYDQARFKGASRDGYDVNIGYNLPAMGIWRGVLFCF